MRLLDAKKAETELRSVRKELESTTGATKGSAKGAAEAAESHHRLSGAFGGLKSALMYGGGLIGLAGVGYGLKDITQGGIQAQERQLLLQQALRQTGQAGSKHMGELHNAISRTSSAGGFAPLEESEGLAQLVRETRSTSAAIRDNREAIMLARGAHESYGTAIMQVQRIETGQVGRLQRYLGIIQPTKYYIDQLTASEKKRFPEKVKEAELLDKEATAREANRRILERYGGVVATYNKSTAGSISNANNAFKQATEQLGEKLLPAETAVAKAFTKIVTEISKGEGVWKTVGKDISTVWKDLEGVYHFLEQHKDLAKLLGYGAAVGIGSHLLKKAPGAGTLTKLLSGGGAAEGAAEGAGGVSLLSKAGSLAKGIGGIAVVGEVASRTLYNEPAYKTVPQGYKDLAGILLKDMGLHGPKQKSLKEREKESVARLEKASPVYKMEHEGVVKALEEALERGMAKHPNPAIHLDGQKLGEALVRNKHLRRGVAEAGTKHVQGMEALK